MISSNDGGVDITLNAGETWFAPPLPISQFYHLSVDNSVPYRIAGSMQDLGTAQGPSLNPRGGIAPSDWWGVGGGEAGYVVSDWSNPDIVYAGEYLGIITRHDRRTGESRNVSAWPENPSGKGGEDMKYRFQWTAPIHVSPHDARVVYHGAQVIFRTADGGQTWDVISPDLTRNDKSRQKWAGGPITGDNTGVETWGTVFTIVESTKEKGLIWAGSDDGLVHVTRDGGKNWSNVTGDLPGAPRDGTISIIEASPFDAATAYVVIDNHRLDDLKPYLYKTSDYGKSWKALHSKLPGDIYLHVVREDPSKRGTLYLGTERGVMYSTDDGANWKKLQLNMPTVAVHDLAVKGDDLIVGTHGRSIWVLDDLQPVRQMSEQIASKSVHLFTAPDAVRWRRGDGNWGSRAGSFSNPPRGGSIYYFLKDKPKGELKIEILDSSSRLVRTASSVARESDKSDDEDDTEDLKKAALPVDPGLHRAEWDLTWEGAKKIRGAKIDTGDPAGGPRAVPGTLHGSLDRRRPQRDDAVEGECGPERDSGASRPGCAARVCAARPRRHLPADGVGQFVAVREGAARGTGQSARWQEDGTRYLGAAESIRHTRQEGRGARGPAAQPESRSDLRHPRGTWRHAALLAAIAAADVGDRRGRRADAWDAAGARGAGEGARQPRTRDAGAAVEGRRRGQRARRATQAGVRDPVGRHGSACLGTNDDARGKS